MLVTGPPRSGRTTALATIAQSAAGLGIPLFHVHVRPTPLAHAPFWTKIAHGPSDGAELVGKLVEVAPRLGRRTLVIVDDLADLADTEADTALAELLRLAKEHPITVDRRGGQHRRPPPVQRHDPGDAQGRHRRVAPAGHRFRRRPRRGHVAPPHPGSVAEGRGYLAERGTAELVHVALPDPW